VEDEFLNLINKLFRIFDLWGGDGMGIKVAGTAWGLGQILSGRMWEQSHCLRSGLEMGTYWCHSLPELSCGDNADKTTPS